MQIHKKALESEINKAICDMKRSSFIEEDRFLIHAENHLQVHVVITRDEDAFLEQYPDEYLAAIKEAKAHA